MKTPRISIIMSVYNGQPFIVEAIESVLKQTYQDYEFIIVDDGSKDDTWQILSYYAEKDKRIILLRNQPNAGVVRALNRGLDQSRGEIIARHDADDISHPDRIQRQVEFLDMHSEYGLVAAVPQLIDRTSSPLGPSGFTATENEEIQSKLMDHMCLCGPTILVRRDCLKAAGFYFSEGLDASEDYDLCLRLAEVTQLGNLPGGLYLYRQHPGAASNMRAQSQMHHKAVALERTIYRRFGPNPLLEKFCLVGRDYLHAAIIGFATKDFNSSQQSLECALAVYPPLLDKDQPLESMVRDYLPSNSTDEALTYIAAIFQNLLPHTHRLFRMKSRLLSDIHMNEVFKGAKQRQLDLVKKHIWPGIRYQPSWLFNRGVISILIKSIFNRISIKNKAS